jgi:hypothetical protein
VERLKDIYTRDFLLDFGRKIQSAYRAFHTADFIASVMDETWDKLPLKGCRTLIRNVNTQLVRYDNPSPLSGDHRIVLLISGQEVANTMIKIRTPQKEN